MRKEKKGRNWNRNRNRCKEREIYQREIEKEIEREVEIDIAACKIIFGWALDKWLFTVAHWSYITIIKNM